MGLFRSVAHFFTRKKAVDAAQEKERKGREIVAAQLKATQDAIREHERNVRERDRAVARSSDEVLQLTNPIHPLNPLNPVYHTSYEPPPAYTPAPDYSPTDYGSAGMDSTGGGVSGGCDI